MMRRPAVALLIGLFAAIVVGAAGYFLLVGPKKADVDKKQKEIESVENQITEQKNTYKQLTEVKNRSAEFESRLAGLQARIPEQPELPALIRNIQAAADPLTGAGLPWLSFAPTDISAATAGGINQYDFNMRVSGFYSEVVDLIYRLERMQRIIVVRSLNLVPTSAILDNTYSANLGLVSCDLQARTFTYATKEGPSAATSTPSGVQTTPGSAPTSAPSSTPAP
jgi:type IV pilus assembly protein PilO